MPSPLLDTKLYIPHAPAGLVGRPRLAGLLQRGLEQAARLILVAAPAGFGKSALVAAWAGALPRPAAWLSLDAQDNDPQGFLSYLAAALQRARPGLGADLPAQLRGAGAPEAAWPLLAGALAQAALPLPVVLDDYHAITSPAIHEGLAFLLERAPVGVTFILATRVAPPLPVARLRAQRQLVEVRLQDLRFTPEEAAGLLNDLNGLALDGPAVAALAARTEGWAAGLQLAALALQAEAGDRRSFLAQFSGSHAFIADYLVEEVLQRQPPAVADFLLRCSILDRFCAPLCAAVAGADAAQSEALLGDLLARNVFLIPLDAERRWLRFHHLFADLLRARLKRGQPALIPELHRRAGAWLEAGGLVGEALPHALAAGDLAAAARMVNAGWVDLIHQGQISTVLRWLAALPAEPFERYPGLSTAYAWALFLKGQVQDVEAWLLRSERALAAPRPAGHPAERADELQKVDAANQALRVFLLYARRELDAAYAQAQRAMPLSRQAGDLLEGNLRIITGNICRELGQPQQAAEHYRAGIALAWRGGNVVGVLSAYAALSRIYRQGGQPQQAQQTCREALDLLREHGIERAPAAGLLYLEWATLLAELRRPAEARAAIDTALEVVRAGGMADLLAACAALRDQLGPPPAEAPVEAPAPAPRPGPAIDALTSRELEVLALLAEGGSNQEIAERLAVSLATVKKHTSSILAKLGARSRTQAVARARQLGLIGR